jgi:hypothetical protein
MPRGIGIKVAEFFRDASRFAIGLMPHQTLGFEQTFIRVEVLRGKTGIEVFSILANKGDEIFHNGIKGFIAPWEGAAMGPLGESKDLVHLAMSF